MSEVYITRTASFLPNSPVNNEQIEDVLGKIAGRPSKAKRVILESNGIKTRYYAMDPLTRRATHSNAELLKLAIDKIEDETFKLDQLECLALATTFPDQFVPSHATMVHGLLKNRPMEIASMSGVCLSGIQAMKYAYLTVKSGEKNNAICGASEIASASMTGERFEEEMGYQISDFNQRPYLAFEKDFLRWMLSDGAGCALLESKPVSGKINLKIDWIHIVSYSHQYETCMYGGGIKKDDGEITGYRYLTQEEWQKTSALALKQDVKLLKNIMSKVAVKALAEVVDKFKLNLQSINYFLPHLSSLYFKELMIKELTENNLMIPEEVWFTNLTSVGNVGSASIYLMLDELLKVKKLNPGEKIVLCVPESARFSMSFVHLTVAD